MNALRKLPTPAAALRAATLRRIGRYEVLDEIASGGMATVYVARAVGPRGFSRLVALKRLHSHLAESVDFVRMFLDEARIASGMRHPNVVSTLDIDDSDGLSLVMEYIDGPSLLDVTQDALTRRERLSVPVCLRVTLDILAGLQAAHELVDEEGRPAGVVHRDVSPHNVLLDHTGVARITDFGIARASARLTHTRDGQVKGKLSYMAPEQVTGESYDHRADVFATGIIAWELLSGRRLFHGTNDAQVLHALLYAPVPELDGKVPSGVAAAVGRALSRDPGARFASCAAFAEALESAATPASHRVVAHVARRYDVRSEARHRSSLPSLPHVTDDDAGRISGVVRRNSDAPECSFDDGSIELLHDAILDVDAPDDAPGAREASPVDETEVLLREVILHPAPRGSMATLAAVVVVVVAALALLVGALLHTHAAPHAAPVALPVAPVQPRVTAAPAPSPPRVQAPSSPSVVARPVTAPPRVQVAPPRVVPRPVATPPRTSIVAPIQRRPVAPLQLQLVRTFGNDVPMFGVARQPGGRVVLR